MRFLIDQAVSWQVGAALRDGGHDAVHVRDVELSGAADQLIVARARAENRVIITQDADFGTILASAGERRPSVVRLRLRFAAPHRHSAVLAANLPLIEQALSDGAIVVIGDAGMRIRRLPILDAGGSLQSVGESPST